MQIQDAGVELILADATQADLAGELPGEAVRVDGPFEDQVFGEPAGDGRARRRRLHPLHLRVDGVPKGVAVTHGNLANYTEDIERLGLGATVCQFGSVSAVSTDLGNTAIFPALAGGGCLHLIDPRGCDGRRAFAAYVDEHPLDVLKITPSHLRDAARCGRPDDPAAPVADRRRRGVHLALAERLSRSAAPALAAAARVLNHYGPTETTSAAAPTSCGPPVSARRRRPCRSAADRRGRATSSTRAASRCPSASRGSS